MFLPDKSQLLWEFQQNFLNNYHSGFRCRPLVVLTAYPSQRDFVKHGIANNMYSVTSTDIVTDNNARTSLTPCSTVSVRVGTISDTRIRNKMSFPVFFTQLAPPPLSPYTQNFTPQMTLLSKNVFLALSFSST